MVTVGIAYEDNVLIAADRATILAGPGWATPPALDGGEWTRPVSRRLSPDRRARGSGLFLGEIGRDRICVAWLA